jgi:hypothetical protein
MKHIESQDTLSLAIFMPNCQFQIIVDRNQIESVIQEIEEALEEQDIGPDKDIKNFEVIKNAYDVSLLLSDDDITSEEAVSTIAYSFLYVYMCDKKITDNVVGILAVFNEESVSFSALDDFDAFQKNVDITRNYYENIMGDKLIDKTPNKPTIH